MQAHRAINTQSNKDIQRLFSEPQSLYHIRILILQELGHKHVLIVYTTHIHTSNTITLPTGFHLWGRGSSPPPALQKRKKKDLHTD